MVAFGSILDFEDEGSELERLLVVARTRRRLLADPHKLPLVAAVL